MKSIFNILSFILTMVFVSAQSQTNYSGTWSFTNTTSEFILTLTQNSSTLSGSHCSVHQTGNKIDCAFESELTISGTANSSDSVIVNFKSSVKGKTGIATIKKLSSTTIEWKITQKPQGEFYIPMYAILTKQ